MNRRLFIQNSSLGVLGVLLFGCEETIAFPFRKNQVIACIGDSITKGGGKGYVELLQKIANEKRPELNLKFLNWGMSSETITGLTEEGHPGPRPILFDRLGGLLETTPIDIAFFCYGINCGIYGKPSPELFDKYRRGITIFLDKVSAKNIEAILLTPPPLVLDVAPVALDENKAYSWVNPYPEYDAQVLSKFREIVLGMEHDGILTKIDIAAQLWEHRYDSYEKDPIHPNLKGHEVIAGAVVDHLGF